jgi:catechol 2,3-dioxygenase-like lactoylglutathione lyase family enzyme
VNICTTRLQDCIKFYGETLGLTIKHPPMSSDFSMGAYAYDEQDIPVIHLVAADREADSVEPIRGAAQRGMIDHFALRCDDPDALIERLTAHGHEFSRMDVPIISRNLIFVRDPNGVMVELSSPMAS